MSDPAHVVINLSINLPPEWLATIAELGRRLAPFLAQIAPSFAVPGADMREAPPTSPVAPAQPAAVAPTQPAPFRRPAPVDGEARWRTDARAAVVRRRYAAGDHVSDIRTELNMLPGSEVTDRHDIGNWAFYLGVRRPAGMKGRRPKVAPWRTPERAVVVRALWPTLTANKEIVAQVNALDGPPVPMPTGENVAKWAFVLGVKRPPGTPNPFQKKVPAPSDADPAEPIAVSVPGAEETPPAAAAPVLSAPAPAAEPVVAAPAPRQTAPAARPASSPPAPAAAPLPTWTPQRTALVRRDYPDMHVRTADLLAKVNALPGAFLSEAWLHNYACSALKLSRRQDAPRLVQVDAPAAGAPPARRAFAREAIESWCRARGWNFEKFDIDAINAKCARLGHPGFTVIEPSRRGAA